MIMFGICRNIFLLIWNICRHVCISQATGILSVP
ncbi:hypothetical protein SAMN06298221_11467 [Sphaerochaeta associata]|nr:hypothetical protein SAMN06298221_11467 [Sphaerochaeta associata]